MKRKTYKSIKKIMGKDKNIDQKIEKTEEQIQDMKEKIVDTREEFIEGYSKKLQEKENIEKKIYQGKEAPDSINEIERDLNKMRYDAATKAKKTVQLANEKEKDLEALEEMKKNKNYIEKEPILRTDQQIKKDIVDNLFWNNSVDASDIKVEVANGTAILSGTVTNYAAKIQAVSETWDVDGVVNIENNIDVKYPNEIEKLMDSDIEQRAMNILAWNPDLESSNIDLSVANGIVSLNGSVDTFWKKVKAEALVGELKGVILVVNHLAVIPTDKTLDKTIGEYILEVLNRNLKIDINQITVTVIDGAVNLSGNVPDKKSYKDVYNAAKYTLGVTEVENNLKVKP